MLVVGPYELKYHVWTALLVETMLLAKYKLVHFTKDPNMNSTHALRLPNTTIEASPSSCYLGIQVDTKRRWNFLDGGGIRGLSSLMILEAIIERIRKEEGLRDVPRPSDRFDLIGGTSTGGHVDIDAFIRVSRLTAAGSLPSTDLV